MTKDEVWDAPSSVALRQWRAVHERLQGIRPEIISALSGPSSGAAIDARVDIFIGEGERARIVASMGPSRVSALAKLGAETASMRGKKNLVGNFWPAMGSSRSVRVEVEWGPESTAADQAKAGDIVWGAYMAVCSYVKDPADLIRFR
jgi:hypothetical protein